MRIFPLRLPMSSEDWLLTGTSLATGLPCLVMTMPSGVTRSSSARHWALNFAAAMVFTAALYLWSEFVSTIVR